MIPEEQIQELTAAGRWKRIRSGQRWAWKRQKNRKISMHQAAPERRVDNRVAINARRALYKKIIGKGSKHGLTFSQRQAAERVERRLAKLYVGNPAQHNGDWKGRRSDTFRGRLTARKHVKV